MTLEEGIIHAEDVARMNQEAAKHLTDEHPTQAEKCEACAEEHQQLAEWLKELKAYKEQSGDCISRKHLLEEIAMLKKSPWFNENTYGSKVIRKEAVEIVEDVCIKREPSVTPQQRTGRWILTDDDFVYCSECEDSYYPRPIDASWYYCPHCGAKMEVEDAD